MAGDGLLANDQRVDIDWLKLDRWLMASGHWFDGQRKASHQQMAGHYLATGQRTISRYWHGTK